MNGSIASMVPTFHATGALVLAATLAFTANAAAAEPLEDAIRGTVRMTEGSASATAFIVDMGEGAEKERRFAIVTGAHVFQDLDAETCTLHFRVPDEEHGFARLGVGLKIRKDDEPLWVRHPTADVAAMYVELPENADVVPFGIEQIASEDSFDSKKIRVGQEVYVPCFPAKVESNDAGFPILRQGSIASYPLNRPTVGDSILIDYSHFGGDSGAPVTAIIDDRLVVVAVATAMIRQMNKIESEFEQRTTHTPLGLATAVRSVLVLETLEKLKKSK